MIYLFAASLGLNLALAWAVTALWSARQRTYRYAVDRSDLTERGCAYSDMASVIVLDGRIKPKNGTIVRDGKLDHRCRPPSSFDFGGDWKVSDDEKYPQDTVWRCECGDYWISTIYNGPYNRRGMWLEWRRAWHDELRELGIGQSDENEDASERPLGADDPS